MLYGAAIDSSCLVAQRGGGPCDRARPGACLQYDNAAFRVRLHALPLVGKFVATWLYCLALYHSVRRDRRRGAPTTLSPPERSTTVLAVAAAADVEQPQLPDALEDSAKPRQRQQQQQ